MVYYICLCIYLFDSHKIINNNGSVVFPVAGANNIYCATTIFSPAAKEVRIPQGLKFPSLLAADGIIR